MAIGGALGALAIMQSVVKIRLAMEAAFCSADPRLIGVAIVPLDDPAQAMAEIEHRTDSGIPIAPLYTTAMAQGLSQHDTASVCEVLGRMAGLKGGKR